MSEWCSNCHTQIHQDSYTSGNSGQQHPAGDGAKLTAAIVTNYNAYVSSGIAAAGNHYTSLVPFEDGSTTFSTLQSRWADTAPATQAAFAAATTSNVMCLSCHKAHASGFYSMLRYPTTDLLTDEAGAYELIDGLSATQMQRAFNERPASVFGVAQRSLCNKCHAKD
jgi:predicted CXXCH cytochrome family protein